MSNLNPYGTYIDILLARIEKCPDRIYTHWIQDDGNVKDISYRLLFDKARQYATHMAAHGVTRHDRVVVILPTGEEFIYTSFGCYMLAACPVPAYPPFRLYDIAAYVKNLAHILRNCEPKIVISFVRAREIIQAAIHESGLKIPHIMDSELSAPLVASPIAPICPDPEDLGLIQYTSGSTGVQKGVALTFNNLLTNNEVCKQHGPLFPEKDVQVSWLPLYHDMGLIGSLFLSFYCNCEFVLMSPQYFLRDPKQWLWAVHRYRGTYSLAPNFSYSLCLRKIQDREIQGIDLSSWTAAGCAAEPIDANIMEQFVERFCKYGLPKTAVLPFYGLAEATVGITGGVRWKKFAVDTIDREELERTGVATPSDKKNASRITCVGKTMPGHDIRIMNAAGEFLPQRHEGEIVIKGPCVMKEYYRNPDATAATVKDGWLHTGDLGYITDDGIYITGRKKDLIIKGGRNFYPHMLEGVVEEIENIRRGCVVAFGLPNEKTGTEDVIILAESRLMERKQREQLQLKIRDTVLSTYGCMVDKVEILPPSSLHKTSSGKIQRTACRESYRKGFFHKKRRLRAWLPLIKIYGENRLQSFRGFFQDQVWSRIWQHSAVGQHGSDYPVVDHAIITIPQAVQVETPVRENTLPPCQNLQELLFYREQHSAFQLYGYILESSEHKRQLTYHHVYVEAQQYARGLRKMGVRKGDRVVIILPKKDFIALFFACTLVGAVPVLIQPPFHLYEIKSYIQYLVHILEDCRPALLVSFADVREITQAAILKTSHPVPNTLPENLAIEIGNEVTPAKINADDAVLIQYIHETTELPKGVVFTHANLLDNLRAIYAALGIGPQDIMVSWIPLFESSLAAASLCAFYGNFPCVLLSPDWALQDPKVWLWTMHQYKGTISLAPALFYQQCSEVPAEEFKDLDLSAWRVALCADDMADNVWQQFSARFAAHQFRHEALCACYVPTQLGLAVAMTPVNKGLPTERVNYRQLVSSNRAEPAQEGDPQVTWMGLGQALPGYRICIVDKNGQPLADGCEGEIVLQGRPLLREYLNQPRETKAAMQGDSLHTGDYGYLRHGMLYLTARQGSVLNKNNQKLYAALLEAAVEKVDGMRPGCVLAFTAAGKSGQELVILAEVQLGISKSNQDIAQAIQKTLQERHACSAEQIVLLPPHTLLTTVTGTIQRAVCQDNYLKNSLTKKTRRVWLEMLKIYSGNRLHKVQDTVKVWAWFRNWRARRRLRDNDPLAVQREMARIIAGEMEIAMSQLKPDVNLMHDLGLDSLKAIELLTIMEENFEVSIPNTVLETHATLESLARYICEQRSQSKEARAASGEEKEAEVVEKNGQSELLLLSAANRNELAQLARLIAEQSAGTANWANLCRSHSSLQGECTLAVVAGSAEDMASKLQQAAADISAQGEVAIEDPRGVYFFSQPANGKVAFLFPGQGVQYLNMLQDLRGKFPVVDATFRQFDQFLESKGAKAITPCLTSNAPAAKDELMQIAVSQPAILVSDLALYRLTQHLGIRPHVVAGHSYGEFIAAHAAGILDEDALLRMAVSISALKQNAQSSNMAMAAVSASAEKIADVLKIVPGSVFIANRNCRVQTVIAGNKQAVEQVVQVCRVIKLVAEVLPIPYAFHCPLAQPVYEGFQQMLESVNVAPPLLPVYSCITGRPYTQDVAAIRSALCEQILKTVEFDATIRNMYADGVRTFVEIGPRNILNNFVKQILHDQEYCAIASNHHMRPGLMQLQHMLAILAARHVPFALNKLF